MTTVLPSTREITFENDTYGIETATGEDDGLILAVAVAIDEMAHDLDAGDY